MKIVALVVVLLLPLDAYAIVSFEWATIGNSGNTSDSRTGYGAVGHKFRISKHEVTNAQYVEFLNAVAASDQHGLYSPLMATNETGGILRSGENGNYSYSVRPDAIGEGPGGGDYAYANKPVNYVSFLDAMRFVNWLENGQPVGTQDSSTTEIGVYSIANGLTESRAASADFFLPNGDEWYKAAFHKNDGDTGNYWRYTTASDTAPNNNGPQFDTGNSANWDTLRNGPYALTDAGAYTLSDGPYGTFDQGGNVWEWVEDLHDGLSQRNTAGGSVNTSFVNLSIDFWKGQAVPDSESPLVGFRVASAASSEIPGDYDDDKDVDGADYHFWKTHYGSSVTAFSGADGNGDGYVDAADYTVWRNHFGGGQVMQFSELSVPEPNVSTCIAAAVVQCIFLWRRVLRKA